jgi:nucleotide-binding universal stress UspA family protein
MSDSAIPSLRPNPIVVGVAPGEPAIVLLEAARFAWELNTDLACVYVNPLRYPGDVFLDGSITSMPILPDIEEVQPEVFDEALAAHIRSVLADSRYVTEGSAPVFTALIGDPAGALSRFAEQVGARAIIVGTRHPGLRASIDEFLSGSVAVRLAHRQPLPVIVIPVAPKPDALPWADIEAPPTAGGR